MLPDDDAGVLQQLDGMADQPGAILITIPYHTRSAELLRKRYGATIHGHPAVSKRLDDSNGFTPIETGAALPGRARAFPIGKRAVRDADPHSRRTARSRSATRSSNAGGDVRNWHRERVDAAARAGTAMCRADRGSRCSTSTSIASSSPTASRSCTTAAPRSRLR